MYRISFYVPIDHAEAVKEALFAAGAGSIGDYDRCSWECSGLGQFRPLDGADPVLGRIGEVERVEELKVELVCADDSLKEALQALVNAHPYEEPAYAAWPITVLSDL